jgi:hypothetical protein
MSTPTMTVRVRCHILFVAAICASPAALCQDSGVSTERRRSAPLPEYIQEFFLSDAVRNQDKGEVQITSGLVTMQGAGTNILLKMEYGVTQRLEFNIEAPDGITEGEGGPGPDRFRTANLGVQYQLIRRDAPIALALGMAFGVPVRSGGEVEYEPMLLAAKSFRKLQVHGSIGADLEESKASLEYNLGSVYPGSVVNFTHFPQKGPKIQHSSPKCLHQSLEFHKYSFSPPGVLIYESDGVSHPPAFG